MEIAADSGDWRMVVCDYREAKADRENQRGEVREMKPAAVVAGGESRLDSVPSDQDGGEGAEQVLPHSIENAQVLLHQGVDRLQDAIKEVHTVSQERLRQPVVAKALAQVAVPAIQVLGGLLPHLHCEIEIGSFGITLAVALWVMRA